MNAKKPSKKYLRLLADAKLVRHFIHEHGTASARDIHQSGMVTERSIMGILGWLLGKNYIKHIGGIGNDGRYQVVPMQEMQDL